MPERHRVLVAEPLGAAGADRLRADPCVDAVFEEGQGRAALLESVGDAAALIVRSGTQVDAELIAAGSGLRVIGRAGVGVDNIDLAAAAERGIAVVN
ncbi:MAG: phosphoglycerate dehydrogenase, partial [Acidimicrobiaceae bacterium]|nr:phosphoglycerate dehydrogenase [Acidimicrobiaceae bacterium]